MSVLRRVSVAFTLAGLLAVLAATPALAVFPQLQTDLTGPAIDGQVPRGTAEIHQTTFPGTLTVRVSKVNLPDGTVLNVVLTDCEAFGTPGGVVGTLTLDGGKGRLTTVLPSEPSVCQVGHNSAIFLTLADGTVVLEGGAPWEVR
jgi:hypothetical protein